MITLQREVQKLLQDTQSSKEELLSLEYRSSRVLNFLKGKILAYTNVLSILEKEKENINV